MATTSRFLSRLKPLALSPSRSIAARPCPPRSRDVHIRATPSTSSIDGPVDLSEQTQAIPKLSGDGPFPADVQFEVLGAPYSLLSIALPASSTLYSRRGTLAGINGKVEDAVSTLSLLEPFRRASLGIPFLYQKISSISPLTCLISTNSPNTTFGVIQLDGKIDWMVTQRKALLAWTGHSISVRPTLNRKLSLAHWGSSKLTGRGLVALIGRGQIYQATLKAGEEFVVHPNHLLAYSINSTASRPAPYRIKSSVLKFQIPSLRIGQFLPEVKFFKVLRNTDTWKALSRILFAIRTWSRRTIWGDRLFLRFQGPGTLLLQSRASRISDVLTPTDVNEFAKVQPGTQLPAFSKYADDDDVGENVATSGKKYTKTSAPEREQREPAALKMVTVKDGKVEFQDSDFRKDFST